MTCFFLSAISLKRLNAVLSAWPETSNPSSSSALLSAWRPGVLAEHDRVGVEADRRRVHDLVGRALLEHAVLVDAGLVGERVAAHDRLVRLHRVAGEARDEAAGARDLARVDAGREADVGGAGVQQHHDLLERRVARALADAVDRALDLARAGLQAGEGVGDGEAEVVVAVDRQHDVAQARHQVVEAAEEGAVLVRHRVADGVGDVDRRGALVERDLHDLGGVLDVGAGGVHGRELDVLDQRARVGDGGASLALDVLARRGELVLDVDVRRRDERVDARARRVAYRPVGGVHVADMNAREPGDHGALDLAGDRLDGLEVARRGDREAGLDDVDAQPRELVGDLELLGRVQRDARRLLAVSQGGVEDENAVVGHVTPPVGLLLKVSVGLRLRGRHALFPPRGRRRRRRCSRSDIRRRAYQSPAASQLSNSPPWRSARSWKWLRKPVTLSRSTRRSRVARIAHGSSSPVASKPTTS